MFRRYASSLLLVGLLFADGSWLGRLEQIFRGFLGGESQPHAVWATSECGGTIDPNGQPLHLNFEAPPGAGASTAERGGSIDPKD